MQWNTSYQESIFSFANNINTHEGGSHLSGFRAALTRTLNAYARNKGLLKEKKDDNLAGEDVREGLTAVISVKLHDPQFEGQTKTKLGNPPIRGLVEETVNRKLAEYLEENPADARRVIMKAIDAARARVGGPQSARPDPQVGAGELDPAGQARRLHGQGPEPGRDLRGRGRLRRRLGEAGPRPQHPGGAAAARQDHQRREEPDRQGPRQQRDPGADHGDRHRRPRRVQHRGRQVPQDRDGDRRRRRRRPHPHPGPHLPLPADAGADRRRLRLHRQTAALPGQTGQPGDLPGARVRTRRAAAARQARGVRADRRDRRDPAS